MISRQQRLLKRRRRNRLTFFCFTLIAFAAFGGYFAWSKQVAPGGNPLSSAVYGMGLAEGEEAGGAERDGDIAVLPGVYAGNGEGAGQAADGAQDGADKNGSDVNPAGSAGRTNGDPSDSQGEGADPSGPDESGADPRDEDAWKEEFYPVPAGPPVDDSYFSDAVFIGDSRVQGLMIYSGLTEGAFYAEKSMSVNDIMTKPIVSQGSGAKISVTDALKKNKFGKVYIKLGLNELGSPIQAIADKYSEIIDEIREMEPGAIIYVQAVIPVTKNKSESSKIHNNPRIQELNELLKKMTWDKGIYYLDIYEGLAGEDGCLPKDASGDGVHLNRTYCQKWLEYLKNHTVQTGEIDL